MRIIYYWSVACLSGVQVSLCDATGSSTPSDRLRGTTDKLSVCVDPPSAVAVAGATTPSLTSSPVAAHHLLRADPGPSAGRTATTYEVSVSVVWSTKAEAAR